MSAWGWVLLGAAVAGWLVLLVVWACLCVGARADRDAEQMEADQVAGKGAKQMGDYGNECEEQVAELRAQLAQAEAAMLALAQPCRWTEDAEGKWHSACGGEWRIGEGTPADNDCVYCPSCGHPLTWVNAAVDDAALKLLAWPADDGLVVPA